MVQGTVPWVPLLSSCQAHFNCIFSLMDVCSPYLSSFGASGALAPPHCVYSSSQLCFSPSGFCFLSHSAELGAVWQLQRWVFPLHSWPSVSIGRKDLFLLYFLLLLPVDGEGKSCRGDESAGAAGRRGGIPRFGALQCAVWISSSFGTLKEREGKGVAVVCITSESRAGWPLLIGLGRIPGQSCHNDLRQFLLQSFCSWLPP